MMTFFSRTRGDVSWVETYLESYTTSQGQHKTSYVGLDNTTVQLIMVFQNSFRGIWMDLRPIDCIKRDILFHKLTIIGTKGNDVDEVVHRTMFPQNKYFIIKYVMNNTHSIKINTFQGSLLEPFALFYILLTSIAFSVN